jgi:hypothetical protein
VRSRSALYGGVAARGTLARTKVEVYGSATIPGETAAWQHALKDVAAVNPFPGDPATTPRLFAYSSAKLRNADLLSLQSEATRETAGSWAHKADLYFIAVTLLAVVLALLGLMASIRQGFGPWLYVAVGLLTAAALISALLAAFTSVTDTPQEAWNAVADGNARLAVADYRGAVKACDRALELREDYVTALRQRAPARVAADSVAVGIYVISNSTPGGLRAGHPRPSTCHRQRSGGLSDAYQPGCVPLPPAAVPALGGPEPQGPGHPGTTAPHGQPRPGHRRPGTGAGGRADLPAVHRPGRGAGGSRPRPDRTRGAVLVVLDNAGEARPPRAGASASGAPPPGNAHGRLGFAQGGARDGVRAGAGYP